MKQFFCDVIFVIMLLVTPAQAWAFQNEPNGFRDLYWGETLEEIQETRETTYLGYSETTNSVTYLVSLSDNEIKTLSGEPILTGCFVVSLWNNRLWDVQLYFYEDDSFSSLKMAMMQLYGYPKRNEEKSCRWTGDTTMILLKRINDAKGGVMVRMGSTEILRDIFEESVRRGW